MVRTLLKYLYIHFFLIFGLIFPALENECVAQNKWVEKGNEAYNEGNYAKALEYLKFAFKQTKEDSIRFKIGVCLYQQKEFDKALDWFNGASITNFNRVDAVLAYSDILMRMKDYERARILLAEVNWKGWRNQVLLNRELAIMEMEDFYRDSTRFHIEKLPFNTENADFSPCLINDNLFFISTRKKDVGKLHYSDHQDIPLSDIYIWEQGKKPPKPIPGNLNTFWFEGPLTEAEDSNSILFTRSYSSHKADSIESNTEKLHIYRAFKKGKQWAVDENLKFQDPLYSFAHPSFSHDKKWLFFSSDIPGGYGGMDIYRIDLSDPAAKPVNLGRKINTPGNEVFPFAGREGLLYFASDGHAGLGGMDIYSSPYHLNGQFDRPVNPGYPLNSSADDFGIFLKNGSQEGWFSSNRGNHPLDDDIYTFGPGQSQLECIEQEPTQLCYDFFERNAAELDPKDGLVYEWDMGDGTRLRGTNIRHCFPSAGSYEVQLNVIDSISGFVFYNQAKYKLNIQAPMGAHFSLPRHWVPEMKHQIRNDGLIPENSIAVDWTWSLDEVLLSNKEEFKFETPGIGEHSMRLSVEYLDTTQNTRSKYCATQSFTVIEKEEKGAIHLAGCKTIEKVEKCYDFFEKSMATIPEGHDLVYEWDLGDGSKKRGQEVRHCYQKGGNYEIRLNLVDAKTGFVFVQHANYHLSISNSQDPDIKISGKKEAKLPMEITLDDPNGIIRNRDALIWEIPGIGQHKGYHWNLTINEPGEYLVKTGIPAKGTNESTCYQTSLHIREKGEVIASDHSHAPESVSQDQPEPRNSGPQISFNYQEAISRYKPQVINGYVTKLDGRVVEGEITLRDLSNAEILDRYNSRATGFYYFKLPDGRYFSFHHSAGNITPVRDPEILQELDQEPNIVGEIDLE